MVTFDWSVNFIKSMGQIFLENEIKLDYSYKIPIVFSKHLLCIYFGFALQLSNEKKKKNVELTEPW